MRWVSVEEGLPDMHHTVLVFQPDYQCFRFELAERKQVLRLPGGWEWRSHDNRLLMDGDVTHWCEVEPPC